MPFNSKHMIDIDDGVLVSSPDDLKSTFADARQKALPIVIHFHGGLNSRADAIKAAELATLFYEKSGAYPFFPIWRTGLFETLGDTWMKIAKETLFHILVDRVSGWTHAQIGNALGETRSLSITRTLPPVTDAVVTASERGDGDFPQSFLGDVDPTALEGEDIMPTALEERAIENELRKDTELKREFDAVLESLPIARNENSRDLGGIAPQPPKSSVADRAALMEVAEDSNVRSLGIGVAAKVVKIVMRVLSRFHDGKDHGLHATVVEEVLRAFYLGSVGKIVWSDMKEDATNSFKNGDSAGSLILAELAAVPENQRVMLVGHSAGAIFISELMRNGGATLRHVEVVFLAPAVRCKLFVDGVVDNAERMTNFRMFSMTDENESRDTLIRDVPGIGDLTWFYPRSLLYLISGILEDDDADTDVLGLQRLHKKWWNQGESSVAKARKFCVDGTNRTSWSINDCEDPRLRTNSQRHGGFGSPTLGNSTMDSVGYLLKNGW